MKIILGLLGALSLAPPSLPPPNHRPPLTLPRSARQVGRGAFACHHSSLAVVSRSCWAFFILWFGGQRNHRNLDSVGGYRRPSSSRVSSSSSSSRIWASLSCKLPFFSVQVSEFCGDRRKLTELDGREQLQGRSEEVEVRLVVVRRRRRGLRAGSAAVGDAVERPQRIPAAAGLSDPQPSRRRVLAPPP